MSSDPIVETAPLGNPPWPTRDPFLFCVHHDDAYPRGNSELGPDASLAGRQIGQDFEGKDGWRMYHGARIPGFPSHPHRGFETVTVVRQGYIDHSDSLGATARFGKGDAQWLTAGAGIVHSEMFPLLAQAEPNPLELFQIWLNLPQKDKMVDPYFTMFWSDQIPTLELRTDAGIRGEVRLVAGSLENLMPPQPPPNSWASRTEADLAIWTIRLDPGAAWTLPAARTGTDRTLYFFSGQSVQVANQTITGSRVVALRGEVPVALRAGDTPVEMLLLQGRPIGEPVAQYGPFVMNTGAEIQTAMRDYQRTQFGGWPWRSADPVHARERSRFARHADGRMEERGW